MMKTGIIGLGFIGPAHMEALLRTGLSQIVAVADTNEQLARSCAAKFNVPEVYSDYRQLLLNPEINVVHICTPNYLHYEIAKAALEAGKHVVCEKPLAICSKQAEELMRLAEEKGLTGVTSFNLRYYPLVQQAREMVQTGKLGRLYAYHGSYLQDWLLYDTDYSWRLDSKVSGPSRAVADIGSHWFDMACFITGSRVTELCADLSTFLPVRKKSRTQCLTFQTPQSANDPMEYEEIAIDTEDFATILFRMENGIRGSLTISQVSAGRKNFLQFEADGAESALSWNSEQPNRLWIGHRDQCNEEMIKDPGLLQGQARKFASYPGGHAEGFPDTSKQLLEQVYSYLAEDGRRHGIKPQFPTFADGWQEARLCEAILESSQQRRWVQL